MIRDLLDATSFFRLLSKYFHFTAFPLAVIQRIRTALFLFWNDSGRGGQFACVVYKVCLFIVKKRRILLVGYTLRVQVDKDYNYMRDKASEMSSLHTLS
jgi:hypothetical protein